jgi:hypothetical protein
MAKISPSQLFIGLGTLIALSQIVDKSALMDSVSGASVSRKVYASERPVIYTFYNQSEEGDHDLLVVWKKKWWDAGWSPVVLTTENSKKHRSYEAIVSDIPCTRLLQWLAVSQAGGGWFAESDVFPLRDFTKDGHSLPNAGKLTIWENVLASLVSGTGEEFNRGAHLLVEHIADQGQFSDVLALVDLQRSYPFGGGFVHQREVLDGRVAARMDLEGIDVTTDCMESKRAVHFDIRSSTLDKIIEWMDSWTSSPCFNIPKEYDLGDESVAMGEDQNLRTPSEYNDERSSDDFTGEEVHMRTISDEYEGIKSRFTFHGDDHVPLMEQQAILRFKNPNAAQQPSKVGSRTIADKESLYGSYKDNASEEKIGMESSASLYGDELGAKVEQEAISKFNSQKAEQQLSNTEGIRTLKGAQKSQIQTVKTGDIQHAEGLNEREKGANENRLASDAALLEYQDSVFPSIIQQPRGIEGPNEVDLRPNAHATQLKDQRATDASVIQQQRGARDSSEREVRANAHGETIQRHESEAEVKDREAEMKAADNKAASPEVRLPPQQMKLSTHKEIPST